MTYLHGLEVIINPMMDDQPRMTPSAEFRRLMTPEMVDDLEAWMLKRFGIENRFYVIEGRQLVCGPKGMAQVHAAQGGKR
ncbi:hypothetical protein AB4Y43_01225 [Paraburkholderia sp. BR10872]|uniref:hypothetical protein n=1 Tax=Paraburkholderia sp. BR10872 TaxID=3236989 RepID=UPI0034D31988